MEPQSDRRLYLPEELPAVLQLNQEQVDLLVRTGQLRPIRICGELRFNARELDSLIQTYQQIADRKEPRVQ
jgi:hypothetical protein